MISNLEKELNKEKSTFQHMIIKILQKMIEKIPEQNNEEYLMELNDLITNVRSENNE
jgi:hypothetical protein